MKKPIFFNNYVLKFTRLIVIDNLPKSSANGQTKGRISVANFIGITERCCDLYPKEFQLNIWHQVK